MRAYARVPSTRAANEFAAWYASSPLKRAGWLQPASAGLRMPGREFIHGRLWRRSVWALRCSWSGDRLRTCVRTRAVHAGARWAAGRSQPAAAGLRMPGREFIHGRAGPTWALLRRSVGARDSGNRLQPVCKYQAVNSFMAAPFSAVPRYHLERRAYQGAGAAVDAEVPCWERRAWQYIKAVNGQRR